MKTNLYLASVFVTALFAGAGAAGPNDAYGQTEAGRPVLAKDLVTPRSSSRLLVMSRSFSQGGDIPDRYTQNGDNVSPQIAWSKGPTGTTSYVVLAEDSGVSRPEPILHWVVYDIPASLRELTGNQPKEAKLTSGAMQGLNIGKSAGFIGPKPPSGQTHPYHFQVFALNKKLNLDPATADRKALVEAMKDHVLAVGDIVGNYTGK